MPVVYTTAYYSLVVRGRIQPGETVLIHSGSGGVGQAAIAIALSLGCRVFTTVGKPTNPPGAWGCHPPTQPCSLGSLARASACQGRPRSGRTSRPGSPSSAPPALPTRGTRLLNSTCCGTRQGRVSSPGAPGGVPDPSIGCSLPTPLPSSSPLPRGPRQGQGLALCAWA